VANLKLIRESLRELEKFVSDLKYRTVDFIEEHATGTYTNRCSRADLLAITRLLPRRDLWKSEVFGQQKKIVQDRYGLTNKQFCVALDVIQRNREMRSILGMESDLKHLADDDIVWVVEQWRRLHPLGEQNEGGWALDYFDATRFETMKEEAEISREVMTAVESRLSPEALAELEAMFYLERERMFVEYYERMIARVRKEHAAAKDPQAEVLHLMEKTNFLHCMQGAAARLGRLLLAERLKAM
jgi:hypothetical protein